MTYTAAHWRREAQATLSLGWPIILTNLAQIAIGTTDTLMMGWLGPTELAAGSLGANLFFAVLILGMGLAMATSPLLAHSLGRARHSVRECRRIVRQGLWLCLAFALPCWAVLWHADALLRALGQDPELARVAGAYVRMLQWSLLPALWMIVLRSFIAALERPRAGMVVTWAAVCLHVGSNWVLMFGHLGAPRLGVVGAGISSTLSFSFMALALMGFILWDRRFRRFHVLGHWWRADWPKFKELLRIGTPMALAMGFEITGFNAAAFLMGLISADSLAAHAIALQVASITFMVPLGMAQAATVRVGLAAGARDAEGVRRAGWVALALGVGFMAAMAALLLLAPQAIVHLFLDPARPENSGAITLAISFLAIAGMFQMVDGAQVVGAGALRGLKDTTMPMLFAGFGYWLIAIPLGTALAFWGGMGGRGIWIGLAIGLGVVASLMVGRWSKRQELGLTPPHLLSAHNAEAR
ncbi:MAG: MATE family efflux transporter [Rhodospirillaceae bacterium]|nr:MATE family efflux transporter [Rhodospirillales bacterium]